MALFPLLAAAFLTQAEVVGYYQTGPNLCQMDYILQGQLYTQPHRCPEQFTIAKR
jgi:hypothetical protein